MSKRTAKKAVTLRAAANAAWNAGGSTLAAHSLALAEFAGDAAQKTAFWGASTFGRAKTTGIALKNLNGAAAEKAVMAFLGGGAKSVGGGGIAGGDALLKRVGIGSSVVVVGLIFVALVYNANQSRDEQQQLDDLLTEFGAVRAESLRAMGAAHPSAGTLNGRWLVRMANELDARGYETLADLPRDVFDEIAPYNDSEGAAE